MTSAMPEPRATPVDAAAVRPHSPLLWNLSKGLTWIWARLWLRYRVEGAEHFPRHGAVLVAANHGSYLDPPLIGISAPRFVHFLAQQGLARFAPLRFWLRHVGVSLIDRSAPSKDVLRLLSRSLEQGLCVAIFPEGTRSRDGRVAAFRSGIEFLVRRTGAPVLPAGIEGSFAAFPRGAAWVRPRRCVVRFSAPWPAERVLAPGGVAALRREIATLAHAGLADDSASEVGLESADSAAPTAGGSQAAPSPAGRPPSVRGEA